MLSARRSLLVALFLTMQACSASDSAESASATSDGAGASGSASAPPWDPDEAIVLGGARPTTLHVPPQYDGTKALPLVVLLHGYGASGVVQDLYLGISAQADALGYFALHPDGTFDATKHRFWNATSSCCDFEQSGVDDDAYLMGLVAEAKTRVQVDPKRVFFVGHSNGGFMSYRLACEHADVIAAVGIIAGASYTDPALCKPSQPVSVLHVHGTADDTIAYEGGTLLGLNTYPSAHDSVGAWVGYDGCSPQADEAAAMDLDAASGSETSVSRWNGCKDGSAVELWTIAGGKHIPAFTSEFAPRFTDWLLAHPKLLSKHGLVRGRELLLFWIALYGD